eukprot:52200-Prymnesium_polylepis.2
MPPSACIPLHASLCMLAPCSPCRVSCARHFATSSRAKPAASQIASPPHEGRRERDGRHSREWRAVSYDRVAVDGADARFRPPRQGQGAALLLRPLARLPP